MSYRWENLRKVQIWISRQYCSGVYAAPWAFQIDLMVSADAVEVRNDLQGGPHPKAIENKKTEYVLSEILVPVMCYLYRVSYIKIFFWERTSFASREPRRDFSKHKKIA